MEEVNYNRIKYLIKQCMLQSETTEERDELNGYQNSPLYQEHIQKALIEAFYMEKPLTDIDSAQREQILVAIKQLGTNRLIRPLWRRVVPWAAAAILLLCTTPLLFKKDKIENRDTPNLTANIEWSSVDSAELHKPFAKDPKPAEEKAILTLADGHRIDLATLKDGESFTRGGLKIEKLEQGNLAIVFENAGTESSIDKMNSISTPRGGLYWVTLGDGTKVQLNASSTLKFPSRFTGNQREVSLEGEGYFEVSKDKLRRFVVNSGKNDTKQQVIVYGTIFNVMAYPEKPYAITTLLEGSVKVMAANSEKETFLVPNQQTTLGAAGLQLAKADLTANLAWKNKLFYFADEKLEHVMLEISRWYDVDIRYQGGVPQLTIWGQISRDKTLSEVLDVLAEMNAIRFDIKGKEVIVRMK